MGLRTSHNCWQGSCSSFNDWRDQICMADCQGTIRDFYGFGGEKRFNDEDPLSFLLNHSDCEGDIKWENCNDIADRLDEVLEYMTDFGFYIDYTHRFIEGLREAYKLQENVEFH